MRNGHPVETLTATIKSRKYKILKNPAGGSKITVMFSGAVGRWSLRSFNSYRIYGIFLRAKGPRQGPRTTEANKRWVCPQTCSFCKKINYAKTEKNFFFVKYSVWRTAPFHFSKWERSILLSKRESASFENSSKSNRFPSFLTLLPIFKNRESSIWFIRASVTLLHP